MPSRYRIAFVQPWFGPWPPWMPLYLESCRRNAGIRWLLFTDQAQPENCPPNFDYFRMSLEELSRQIGEALKIDLALKAPYKLCDFKATYGVTFAPFLQGIDFWGMSDLDLVWGDILRFYPDELLAQYDVLTSERACFNGQCTLFRNSDHVNTIFRRVPGLEKIYHDPAIYFLDENLSNAAALEMEKAGELRVLRRRLGIQARYFHPWQHWAEALELKEKGHLRDLPPLLHRGRWEEGRLYHIPSGRECLFFHFGTSKKNYCRRSRAYPFWPEAMSGWTMSTGKIRMQFRPGHVRARWDYFWQTTRGPDVLGRIRNIPDALRAHNIRRRIVRFFMKLIGVNLSPAGHVLRKPPSPS